MLWCAATARDAEENSHRLLLGHLDSRQSPTLAHTQRRHGAAPITSAWKENENHRLLGRVWSVARSTYRNLCVGKSQQLQMLHRLHSGKPWADGWALACGHNCHSDNRGCTGQGLLRGLLLSHCCDVDAWLPFTNSVLTRPDSGGAACSAGPTGPWVCAAFRSRRTGPRAGWHSANTIIPLCCTLAALRAL